MSALASLDWLASERACMRRELLLVLLALLLLPSQVLAKPRARIPDALDDVLDDEESDDWRNWGQQKEAKQITGPAPRLQQHRRL